MDIMTRVPSLEKRSAAQLDFINGGPIVESMGKKERYYPDQEIYDYCSKHNYIRQVKGKTKEGRPKYEITSEGKEFREKKWLIPYRRSAKEWKKKVGPTIKTLEDSIR